MFRVEILINIFDTIQFLILKVMKLKIGFVKLIILYIMCINRIYLFYIVVGCVCVVIKQIYPYLKSESTIINMDKWNRSFCSNYIIIFPV